MQYDWAKSDWKFRHHHERFKKYIDTMPKPLICQECRGAGGWTEYIDYYIGGPRYTCDWCEGTGFVTPHIRSRWLNMRRAEKRTDRGSRPLLRRRSEYASYNTKP